MTLRTVAGDARRADALMHWAVRYAMGIWAGRFFALHLARSDLRAKYRRSSLGLVWAVLHPLAMTGALALVLSVAFRVPVEEYAPFVFSGLVCWELLSFSLTAGCNAFLMADAYIRQMPQPLALYPLRHVLAGSVNFLLGLAGLVVWVLLWRPENLGSAWLALPLSFALWLVTLWPAAILLAFFNTRYRDIQQLVVISLQIVWYMTPVFILPETYRQGGLGWLVDDNPLYHLLRLFRAPLLEGKPPDGADYAYALVCAGALWLAAVYQLRRRERMLVFYL